MKRFLLTVITLVSLLSCSKDIILDLNRGAAIEFTVAAQTRAQELTGNNLKTFYATAVDPRQDINYFSEVPYIKSGEYYHSSPTYYWPGDGSPLNIYAYAPSASDLGVSASGESETRLRIDKAGQILENFSPAAEISDQQDFITAYLPEFRHSGNGQAVYLPFKHQLAQIEIKAKNSNEGQIYHVKGVKIAQIKSKGDFDFSTQKWTLDDEAKAVYEVIYEDVRTLDAYGVNIMAASGDNAMLLPQAITPWDPQDDQQNDNKGAYVAVLMKITTSSGASVSEIDENDGYQWVAAPFREGTEWVAGNKYIYTLDFTNGASYSDPSISGGGVLLENEIQFDVDIVDWSENENLSFDLLGNWYFHDSMIVRSTDGKIQDRRWFNSYELAQTMRYAVNSVNFTTSSSVVINIGGESISLGVVKRDGILYLNSDLIPDNMTVFISDYSESHLTLEISFIDPYDNMSYRYIQNFTRKRNFEGENWRTNLCGTWEFEKIVYTYMDDSGQIIDTEEVSILDDGSPFGMISFAYNDEENCFDATFEGVEDFITHTRINGGLFWEVDTGTFSFSFYITDITSDSISIYQTDRVEYNGTDVYREGIIYYNKVTTNE